MTDPLLRALEDELGRLRRLREAVLEVLADPTLSRQDKLGRIEVAFLSGTRTRRQRRCGIATVELKWCPPARPNPRMQPPNAGRVRPSAWR